MTSFILQICQRRRRLMYRWWSTDRSRENWREFLGFSKSR